VSPTPVVNNDAESNTDLSTPVNDREDIITDPSIGSVNVSNFEIHSNSVLRETKTNKDDTMGDV